MGYRELPPPNSLQELVETAWVVDGAGEVARVLPDGCMDLIRMHGRVVVAGPDTTASLHSHGPESAHGLRFRPGVLPRLLGVPAAELRNRRVPLDEFDVDGDARPLTELTSTLAARATRTETAPWSLTTLRHVTAQFAMGATVPVVADEVGWSARTLQRHCRAVYGYGPTTLRRILRFRRATSMLRQDRSIIDVAASAGYADQPHLYREIREFAGTSLQFMRAEWTQDGKGENRSTDVPSGSSTVA